MASLYESHALAIDAPKWRRKVIYPNSQSEKKDRGEQRFELKISQRLSCDSPELSPIELNSSRKSNCDTCFIVKYKSTQLQSGIDFVKYRDKDQYKRLDPSVVGDSYFDVSSNLSSLWCNCVLVYMCMCMCMYMCTDYFSCNSISGTSSGRKLHQTWYFQIFPVRLQMTSID